MLGHKERGPVTSLRTQARGDDVGAGDQNAVRVMDLLNRNGRRLVQVDVWRTEVGAWRAGAWSQVEGDVGADQTALCSGRTSAASAARTSRPMADRLSLNPWIGGWRCGGSERESAF